MHTALKSFVSTIYNAAIYLTPTTPIRTTNLVNTTPTGMAPTEKKAIFKDVRYYDSASALAEQHRRILANGGATEETAQDSGIDWSRITHVFTLDLDFPGKQEVMKQTNIAIVTVPSPPPSLLTCSLDGSKFRRCGTSFKILAIFLRIQRCSSRGWW